MGQSLSYGLNQVEVEELVELCNVTQAEIGALYKRFRSLDRGRKGFLTAEEFLSIPELSINPLAKRLAFFYDGINFREFCKMIAPFSSKASAEEQVKYMFAVWDVDGDGIVSASDIELIVRQAGGASMNDEEVRQLASTVAEQARYSDRGLTIQDFQDVLKDSDATLCVEIPSDD